MGLKWESAQVARSLSDDDMLEGGRDSDGTVIYVGRAYHKGICMPAKVMPSKDACYVCYGGEELLVHNYEVLAMNDKHFSWQPSSSGFVPFGAVATGSDGGDTLYVGRGHHDGSLTVGKIHPGHKCLYIPYGGEEVCIKNYEVLVYEPKLEWVPTTSSSPLPDDAILGGSDVDGSEIYVGRAYHKGDLLPCKVIPDNKVAYIAYGGSEVAVHNFEILTGEDVQWEYTMNGDIPDGAFPGGQTSDGETLFIGRVEHDGAQTVGKVHQSHGCLYVPFGGQEVAHTEYETLIGK